MRHKITGLFVLFLLLLVISSCSNRKVYKSHKYIASKSSWHFWHRHGDRPHAHYGGYW